MCFLNIFWYIKLLSSMIPGMIYNVLSTFKSSRIKPNPNNMRMCNDGWTILTEMQQKTINRFHVTDRKFKGIFKYHIGLLKMIYFYINDRIVFLISFKWYLKPNTTDTIFICMCLHLMKLHDITERFKTEYIYAILEYQLHSQTLNHILL